MKIYEVEAKTGLETQLEGTWFHQYYKTHDRAKSHFRSIADKIEDVFIDEEYNDGNMICRSKFSGVVLRVIEVLD